MNPIEYVGVPGHVVLETQIREARGKRTLFTCHDMCESVEGRDGMVPAGMQRGLNQSMDRLAELAAIA